MGMTHDKKLEFLHKIAKLGTGISPLEGVQHLDAGGVAGPAVAAGNDQNTNGAGVIGAVNGLIGLNNNFSAQGVNVQAGTNAGQLNQAYQGAQSGIAQQQGVSNALAPGLAQGANSEAAIANQYANEAAGNGPNPAQAALNQSTGQNIAQTAALMAGQRGAGANAGNLAVNAAQLGAGTQQQAVGQAATLQAEQQLAAQQQGANLANAQVSQAQNAVTGLNQVNQNEQNILQGANTSFNNANVGMQSNINNVNAGISTANQNMNANTLGGILNGASGAVSAIGSMVGFAHGGLVKMDKGGNVLDANARKHIAPEHFALPGRRYPIHDIEHARNALARVSQNGSPAEKAKVKAAVHKKYPSLAGKKMAEGGEVEQQFQPTSSDTSNGPSIPATEALPADQTNFSSAVSGGGKSGGGASSAASLAPALAAMFNGGEVKHGFMKARMMALGGYVPPQSLSPGGSISAPQSFVGQFVNTQPNVSNGPNIGTMGALPVDQTNFSQIAKQNKKSNPQTLTATRDIDTTGQNIGATDLVPDSNMPGGDVGEQYAYRGGLAATGGRVNPDGKDERAVVKGDSLKNDKVPTMLSQGEIVIPRHITMSDRAPEKAAAFVAETLAKRKKA